MSADQLAATDRDQDPTTMCSCGCDRARHVHDGRPHAGACIDCTCQAYRRLEPHAVHDVAVCLAGLAVAWLLVVAFWTWS